MKKQIFEKEDRVFDIEFGWGTVVRIENEFESPVIVDFDRYEDISFRYRFDGRCSSNLALKRLSFTEYTLQGFTQEKPVNYEEYVGKWGKFWNSGDKVLIDILIEIDTEEYGRMVFGPYITNMYYDNFEPLTEEQIKILEL